MDQEQYTNQKGKDAVYSTFWFLLKHSRDILFSPALEISHLNKSKHWLTEESSTVPFFPVLKLGL